MANINIKEVFKTWWMGVLCLGICFMIIPLFLTIEFIKPNHLFGLGLGLTIVGFSYLAAQKYCIIPHKVWPMYGYLEGNITVHNLFTRILLSIGVLLTILFFALIVIDLI